MHRFLLSEGIGAPIGLQVLLKVLDASMHGVHGQVQLCHLCLELSGEQLKLRHKAFKLAGEA